MRIRMIGRQAMGRDRALSDREKRCLSLAWAGKILATDLKKFGLSENECNKALGSAARKLDVLSPAEAVVRALRLNLLSPI